MSRVKLIIAALCATLAVSGAAKAQATLAQVKARGQVLCGVGENAPGFFSPDSNGQYSGFDVDYCRALAAGILGDRNKVKFLRQHLRCALPRCNRARSTSCPVR